MALNTYPNLQCSHWRHIAQDPPEPAIGFVLEASYEGDEWRPYGALCIEELRKDPTVTHEVALLDPARQRRPNPDHYDPHPVTEHKHAVGVDCNDGCRTYVKS